MTLTLPYPDRSSINGKLTPPAERAEVIVVGAGAAGCAAAIEAARGGAAVMLIDENPVAPGLIGMDVPLQYGGRAGNAVQNPERLLEQILETSPALAEAFEAGVDVRLSTSVWGAWANGQGISGFPGPVVGVADEAKSWLVGFDRLIVATGARDLNFTFAGSDQPGVMGAQAFHALLTRYGAFDGKRIVILGSGALAVATATLAAEHGVEIAAIVEARAAAQSPALGASDAPLLLGHVPLAAHAGVDGIAGLTVCDVADPSRNEDIACDTIVVAVGAVPVIELFDVLGAARSMDPLRGGHVPTLGEHGATSVPGVWAAGECAGLGGDPVAEGIAAARAALASLKHPAEPAASAHQTGRPRRPRLPARLGARAHRHRRSRGHGVPLRRGDPRRAPRRAAPALPRLALQPDGAARSDHAGRGRSRQPGPDQAPHPRLHGPLPGPPLPRTGGLTMAIGAGAAPETVPLAGYRAPVRPLPLSVLADLEESAEARRDWNVWFGILTQWIGYEDIGTDREKEQMNAGMPY